MEIGRPAAKQDTAVQGDSVQEVRGTAEKNRN
jgi:hypothetical protein